MADVFFYTALRIGATSFCVLCVMLSAFFLAWKKKRCVCVASDLYVLLGERSAFNAPEFSWKIEILRCELDPKSLCLL